MASPSVNSIESTSEINASRSKTKFTSAGKYCKAYGCKNCQFKCVNGEKVPTNITFFKVPPNVLKDNKLLKHWACLVKRQLGRDNFTMNNTTVFCEKHFRDSDIIRLSRKGVPLKNPRLRNGAAPVIHSWSQAKPERPTPKVRHCPPPNKAKGSHGLNRNDVLERGTSTPTFMDIASGSGLDPGGCMDTDTSAIDDSPLDSTATTQHTAVETATSPTPGILITASTQTKSDSTRVSDHDYTFVKDDSKTLDDYKDYVLKLENKILMLEKERTSLNELVSSLKAQIMEFKSFSAMTFKEDNSAIRFYTGFPSFDVFMAVYRYLAPKAANLQYRRSGSTVSDSKPFQMPGRSRPGPKRKCTLLDEFFLVMVRLRVGLFHKDLAIRFGLSESTVSRIISTWINFLYLELPQMHPFPSQSEVRANMPLQFSKYPTTRIIIDCTEIFIEVPSAMLAQSQTWSNYKHHNTWKVLVGISPNGMITFVSKLWSGRISDKAITRESGLLDLLEPGDNVMADRGFEITDILPPGVTLNIPPFKGERAALSPSEVQETMDIACVRIHVERAIERIKNYHILDGNLPISMTLHADQVFTVCAYLTNFLPPLVQTVEK
ncbi:uncharacterized protein LOC118430999 [Branchiostoma floridae]|uniref:Uncharacterized protein LOC118430999 n=1 Tax=Branchiostoma floridae TaxID=7739 RepID=A0A9J7MBR4_BRAFL|nr:uncharacterized protein LOC118430999 [Branchiostoma floridae]